MQTHTITSQLTPLVLVGYLDIIKQGLQESIVLMEENQALNRIAFMLEPSQVKLAPPEMLPIISEFHAGLQNMLQCRDTLVAVEGIALCIRKDLAIRNGVSAENQHETAAFAADMISNELENDR